MNEIERQIVILCNMGKFYLAFVILLSAISGLARIKAGMPSFNCMFKLHILVKMACFWFFNANALLVLDNIYETFSPLGPVCCCHASSYNNCKFKLKGHIKSIVFLKNSNIFCPFIYTFNNRLDRCTYLKVLIGIFCTGSWIHIKDGMKERYGFPVISASEEMLLITML